MPPSSNIRPVQAAPHWHWLRHRAARHTRRWPMQRRGQSPMVRRQWAQRRRAVELQAGPVIPRRPRHTRTLLPRARVRAGHSRIVQRAREQALPPLRRERALSLRCLRTRPGMAWGRARWRQAHWRQVHGRRNRLSDQRLRCGGKAEARKHRWRPVGWAAAHHLETKPRRTTRWGSCLTVSQRIPPRCLHGPRCAR